MRHIEALLRRHIGLDSAAVGAALIERTVRLRMKQHGLKNTDTYRDLLATNHHELDELIEAVVVTETWFFRDQEPFHAFTQLALQKQSPQAPSDERGARNEPDLRAPLDPRPLRPDPGALRILSLPCASGEEPYSIAMALLDAGVPEANFTIDAADISTRALARAKHAVYGKNSFRGRELAFRDRHFLPTPEGYALGPHVRRCVTFARGNILNDNFPDQSAPYDFIFCRNLLIYFDAATQTLALGNLHRWLATNGILFVGPAEIPLAVASGFVNTGLPMAFACHKVTSSQKTKTRRPQAELRPPARAPRPANLDTLKVAHQHANAGRLTEAVALCKAHLASAGPTAQAYYLLGLASEASGAPAAIPYYRKALYLEPNHYDTLVQITRALEKAGDLEAARIHQRRAERAQPKS